MTLLSVTLRVVIREAPPSGGTRGPLIRRSGLGGQDSEAAAGTAARAGPGDETAGGEPKTVRLASRQLSSLLPHGSGHRYEAIRGLIRHELQVLNICTRLYNPCTRSYGHLYEAIRSPVRYTRVHSARTPVHTPLNSARTFPLLLLPNTPTGRGWQWTSDSKRVHSLRPPPPNPATWGKGGGRRGGGCIGAGRGRAASESRPPCRLPSRARTHSGWTIEEREDEGRGREKRGWGGDHRRCTAGGSWPGRWSSAYTAAGAENPRWQRRPRGHGVGAEAHGGQ